MLQCWNSSCCNRTVLEFPLRFERPKTQKIFPIFSRFAEFNACCVVDFCGLCFVAPVTYFGLKFKAPCYSTPSASIVANITWSMPSICNTVMKRSETAETANSKKNFWLYGHDRMAGAPLDCQIRSTFTVAEKWRLKISKVDCVPQCNTTRLWQLGQQIFGAPVARRLQLQISVLMLLSTVQLLRIILHFLIFKKDLLLLHKRTHRNFRTTLSMCPCWAKLHPAMRHHWQFSYNLPPKFINPNTMPKPRRFKIVKTTLPRPGLSILQQSHQLQLRGLTECLVRMDKTHRKTDLSVYLYILSMINLYSIWLSYFISPFNFYATCNELSGTPFQEHVKTWKLPSLRP